MKPSFMRNYLWPKASLKGKRENNIETVIFTTSTLNNGGRIPSALRFLSFYQPDKSLLLGRSNYKADTRGRNSIPINSQREEVRNIIIQKIWEENYPQPNPLRCLPGWHTFRTPMGKNILNSRNSSIFPTQPQTLFVQNALTSSPSKHIPPPVS